MKKITQLLLTSLVILLASCGGGGGGNNNNNSGNNGNTGSNGNNQVAVTLSSGNINVPTVSVTICAPGTSNCQTINNILVDTGSTGLRLVSSVINQNVLNGLTAVTSNSQNVVECMQFADGYSWGSIKQANIQIGGETASNVPIQVIGDPNFTNVPTNCSSTSAVAENTVATLGSNGILGISNFVSDCGPSCATNNQNTIYYTCPTGNGTCTGAAIDTSNQVPNPVSLFSTDNNGTILTMSAPNSTTGSATATGTLTFGVGTQNNNAMPGTFYTVDDNEGFFNTSFNNALQSGFLDSGSNVYFVNDSQITQCPSTGSYAGFYCPTSQVNLNATITGLNGNSVNVGFNIGDFQTLLTNNPSYTAFSNVGAYTDPTNSFSQDLDFGLPFFYGRTVATILEGKTITAGTGPAVAF
jgi:hypothetical protein